MHLYVSPTITDTNTEVRMSLDDSQSPLDYSGINILLSLCLHGE